MPKRIILASASPRRKQLLEQVGLIFDIIPSNIDESSLAHNDPLKNAQAIALYKAQNVAIKVKEGIVIGADTQVTINGEILG
ncbi:MAG: Maf family protein, partial [Candidatus Poribacteria bacterium]